MDQDIGPLLDKLRAELCSLRLLLQDQIGSIRDSSEAQRQAQEQISTHLAALRIEENEKEEARTYRKKNHSVQVMAAITTGLAFLAAAYYAGVANRQLCEMKRTNELNRQSFELSKNMFRASQAAVFTCQMMVQFEASRVLVECRNVGQISATDVRGEAILTRGRNAPPKKLIISSAFISKGETFSVFYPVDVPSPGPTQFNWIARQHIRIETNFRFNDGFEVKPQSFCGALYVDVKQRSYGGTDCEIAKELEEGSTR